MATEEAVVGAGVAVWHLVDSVRVVHVRVRAIIVDGVAADEIGAAGGIGAPVRYGLKNMRCTSAR